MIERRVDEAPRGLYIPVSHSLIVCWRVPSLLLRMEDSRSVAGWMGGQEILTGHILSVDQVTAIIDAITAEELKQLAQELLVGSKLCLAVVGPVTKHEPLETLLKL